MKFKIWSTKVSNDDSLEIEKIYPRLAEDKAFEKNGVDGLVDINTVSDLLRIGDETKNVLVINCDDKDIRIDDDYF